MFILLFFLMPLFLYVILVTYSWTVAVMSNKTSLSLSIRMTNLVNQYNFREELIDISGITIHSVIKDPTGAVSDDVFVFIHGTASASITFFDLMNELQSNIKCVAIDLPSFGISDDIDIDLYPTNEEICIKYATIIGETLDKLDVLKKRTILVGHSLGGFLSIYVASRYPIKNLILLNPAGILPTLGVWGYYWAIFFKLGLPTTIFNLPLVSRNGMIHIMNLIFSDNSNLSKFWLSFYSNPHNKGHEILQKIITFKPRYSYWNTPAFTTLMDVYKMIPTTICFGVNDTICPPHIGSFLKYVSHGQIMIHNIHDANHNPCVNTVKMADLLKSISDNQEEGTINITLKKSINTTNKVYCKGYSYPSLTKTQESIEQFYNYLLTNIT